MKPIMCIDKDRTKIWKIWLSDIDNEGIAHRLDGPAVKYKNSWCFWYVEDRLHRLNGPVWNKFDSRHFWAMNLMISYDPVMDTA